MIYRNFDDSQWRNKVEELEKRIRDLEEENERLRHPKVKTDKDVEEAIRKAMERNPEFFMSTKEKKALQAERRKIAESLGLTLRQYGILTKKGPKKDV